MESNLNSEPKRLEARIINETLKMQYLIAKQSPELVLSFIDTILQSNTSFISYFPFVRHAISILAKNQRLVDAKELADRFFEAQKKDGLRDWNQGFEHEYEDICRRISNSIDDPEPTSLYYDAIYASSSEYEKEPSDSVYYDVWKAIIMQIETIQSQLPFYVLDIGCGPGQFARLFSECLNNYSYLGIDTSRTAISQAQSRNPNYEFICGAIDTVPAEYLHRTNLFLVLEVLEHIVNDLGLIASLPAGKTLIFSVPNFDSFGHIRFFKNVNQVHERYNSVVDHLVVNPIPYGTRGSIIYVCQGTTLQASAFSS